MAFSRAQLEQFATTHRPQFEQLLKDFVVIHGGRTWNVDDHEHPFGCGWP